MKIIHVISALTKGGGERVAVELANIAVQKGDTVTIVAAWPVDPAFLQNIIDPGVNLRFVGRTKRQAYLNIIPWILKNRKWMRNQDVLHCHLTFGAVFGSIAGILVKGFRKRNPIIVETYHAVGMPIPKLNRWFHSRMLLLRNGLVFMAKDPYWSSFIERHPRLKIAIIPNGMSVKEPVKNEEAKQKLCHEMEIPPGYRYLVGTVGMLRPERRPELYIPIFREIKQALGNDVHFIIGGDGVEFAKIKMLVEEQGLKEQVHMPGIINSPAGVISFMDVYVSVSVGDAVGISMIEAAMCKVPVIGIQLLENYQAKKEDWVWSHTDTLEVAKKIIFFLQHSEERNKLIADQHKYVNDHFTSAAMYASYDSFYKSILA